MVEPRPAEDLTIGEQPSSSHGRSGSLESQPTGWRATSVAAVAAVGALAGLVAAGPLFLSVLGAIQFSALARGSWDATWNDGDGWITLAGAVALLIILAATALAGYGVSRALRTPRSVTVWISLGGCLLVSGIIVALLLSRLHF